MLKSTLEYLKCPTPRCKGALSLKSEREKAIGDTQEIISGLISCKNCQGRYPILKGVAVIVPESDDYLLTHVKGISRWVPDSEIPAHIREDFKNAREAIEEEHIEEDLEAERVTSLYVMNHYLHARKGSAAWWKGGLPDSSPEIAEMIERFWDHGPFKKISDLWDVQWGTAQWGEAKPSLVELGCGVGGLYPHLASRTSNYLGVDSSFASIALARQLSLQLPRGLEKNEKVLVPGDLIDGTVSYDVNNLIAANPTSHFSGDSLGRKADFIVGHAEMPPVKFGVWDVSAALNMIDMLDEPASLSGLQKSLVKPGGTAIQSSPYVWHPYAARSVKERTGEKDSARAVEMLYEGDGFKIEHSLKQVPWLFFKHVRQLEIYSVHLFFAKLDNRKG